MLPAYQLIVGGVSLAGVGADIHHLLPHRLVHVRVANHRVAETQRGLQLTSTARYLYLFSWFHETVGCVQLSWYVHNNRKRSIKSKALR